MWVTKINLGGFTVVFPETIHHAEFMDFTSFIDLNKMEEAPLVFPIHRQF